MLSTYSSQGLVAFVMHCKQSLCLLRVCCILAAIPGQFAKPSFPLATRSLPIEVCALQPPTRSIRPGRSGLTGAARASGVAPPRPKTGATSGRAPGSPSLVAPGGRAGVPAEGPAGLHLHAPPMHWLGRAAALVSSCLPGLASAQCACAG